MMVQGVFDQHTIPITNLLRDVGIDPWSVNWIPMDHPEHNTESLTNHFLSSNKIPLRVSFEQRRHIANEAKKKCYEIVHNMKLYSLVQTPNPFGAGNHYERHFMSSVMREDIDLYVQVMKKYNVDLYEFEDPNREVELAELNRQISEAYMEKTLGIKPKPRLEPEPQEEELEQPTLDSFFG